VFGIVPRQRRLMGGVLKRGVMVVVIGPRLLSRANPTDFEACFFILRVGFKNVSSSKDVGLPGNKARAHDVILWEIAR